MMTLHDTIEMVKKVVIFGIIGAILIFLLIMLFRFGGFLKDKFFPTPPPAAVTAFGKLPVIVFPEGEQSNEYSYTIDTITGTFPTFNDRVNIYAIVKPLPEFYDLTRAKTKAKTINLLSLPTPLGDNTYRWSEEIEPKRQFIINIVTDNFNLSSSYLTFAPVESAVYTPDPNSAIGVAEEFFDSLNSFPNTINSASTSARTMVIQNGNLVETTSLQDTQIVRVDFYRHVVDNLEVYGPYYPNSLMYALVGSGTNRPMILEANYSDQLIGQDFSDYPIKTAEQAFKELEQGKGHIASYRGKDREILIKDIHLGYYLGATEQRYLMPIVIFTGEDGFTAFVSAVSDSFTE